MQIQLCLVDSNLFCSAGNYLSLICSQYLRGTSALVTTFCRNIILSLLECSWKHGLEVRLPCSEDISIFYIVDHHQIVARMFLKYLLYYLILMSYGSLHRVRVPSFVRVG